MPDLGMVDLSRMRRIVLLVPSPDGNAVLASGTDLPALDCTLQAGENTIEAVATVLTEMGLTGPILDCVVDQRSNAELDGEPRSALVQLDAPPPEWTPAAPWAWQQWSELDHTPAAPVAVVTNTRIAELRGDAAVPAERAAWARPGWYEQATDWIKHSLAAAGRAAPDAIVQSRHWGISALIRVEASDGRSWFKASFPPFHNEAPISALLAELAPGATCYVIAADANNGWLLVDDFAGTTDATDAETTRDAVEHLVQLEHKLLPHTAALLAGGCEHRPLRSLAAELQTSLAAPVVTEQIGLTAHRVIELVDACTQAVATVDAVGLPETLLHGDFHPGNVATTGDGMLIFDWSDGAIGSPVIEAATWGWWYEDDEPRLAVLWGHFCEAWRRAFTVDMSHIASYDIDIVAGAFHTVSYERILTALEPTERPSHADGLERFFGLLSSGAELQRAAD